MLKARRVARQAFPFPSHHNPAPQGVGGWGGAVAPPVRCDSASPTHGRPFAAPNRRGDFSP
jgi:hypothetical protein